MTFDLHLSSQQSAEALQSGSEKRLYVAQGVNVEQLCVRNVAPTNVLCLVNAKARPGDWESVLSHFHQQVMHTFVNVIDAPLGAVKHDLYTAVMEKQDIHHYHNDNGVYALWDTCDNRTVVMIVSNSSETFFPLQIAGKVLQGFTKSEHEQDSLWGGGFEDIGCNISQPLRALFDNILAFQTHNVLTNAVVISNMASKIKKM